MEYLYIANVRIPTEKAHGYAIMHMCAAFVSAGVSLSMAIPRRRGTGDPFMAYHLHARFPIITLPTIDLVRYASVIGRVAFYLQSGTFYGSLFVWGLFRKRQVVYTRDFIVLALSFVGYDVFYECHMISASRLFFPLAKRARGIVVISKALRAALIEGGVAEPDILVAPSSVDLSVFDISITKAEARSLLQLPSDPCIAVYTGSFTTFGQDKGIADIFAALQKVQQDKIFFVAAGGSPEDVRAYQTLAERAGVASRVKLVGRQDQLRLALYQKAADVLLMPFPDTPHYRHHMSPMKIYEYAAGKRPIIASDLPTIRDALDESTAVMILPGDTDALARALIRVADAPDRYALLAEAAYEKVALHNTWDVRAKRVLRFIGERTRNS